MNNNTYKQAEEGRATEDLVMEDMEEETACMGVQRVIVISLSTVLIAGVLGGGVYLVNRRVKEKASKVEVTVGGGEPPQVDRVPPLITPTKPSVQPSNDNSTTPKSEKVEAKKGLTDDGFLNLLDDDDESDKEEDGEKEEEPVGENRLPDAQPEADLSEKAAGNLNAQPQQQQLTERKLEIEGKKEAERKIENQTEQKEQQQTEPQKEAGKEQMVTEEDQKPVEVSVDGGSAGERTDGNKDEAKVETGENTGNLNPVIPTSQGQSEQGSLTTTTTPGDNQQIVNPQTGPTHPLQTEQQPSQPINSPNAQHDADGGKESDKEQEKEENSKATNVTNEAHVLPSTSTQQGGPTTLVGMAQRTIATGANILWNMFASTTTTTTSTPQPGEVNEPGMINAEQDTGKSNNSQPIQSSNPISMPAAAGGIVASAGRSESLNSSISEVGQPSQPQTPPQQIWQVEQSTDENNDNTSNNKINSNNIQESSARNVHQQNEPTTQAGSVSVDHNLTPEKTDGQSASTDGSIKESDGILTTRPNDSAQQDTLSTATLPSTSGGTPSGESHGDSRQTSSTATGESNTADQLDQPNTASSSESTATLPSSTTTDALSSGTREPSTAPSNQQGNQTQPERPNKAELKKDVSSDQNKNKEDHDEEEEEEHPPKAPNDPSSPNHSTSSARIEGQTGDSEVSSNSPNEKKAVNGTSESQSNTPDQQNSESSTTLPLATTTDTPSKDTLPGQVGEREQQSYVHDSSSDSTNHQQHEKDEDHSSDMQSFEETVPQTTNNNQTYLGRGYNMLKDGVNALGKGLFW